jgi:hypothetical protein
MGQQALPFVEVVFLGEVVAYVGQPTTSSLNTFSTRHSMTHVNGPITIFLIERSRADRDGNF